MFEHVLNSQVAVVTIAWVMIGLAWLVWVPLALPLLGRRRTCWSPSLTVSALGRVAALGYLGAALAWATLAVLGLDPAGVGDTIVVLTAMHFHYAGFAASLLVARLDDVRAVPWPAALAVSGGPLVVAAGFTFWSELQAVGAGILGLGLAATAVLTLAGGTTSTASPVARACLLGSSLAVVVGMALAVHWAVGSHLGWRVLGLDQMARTHGMLNGLGFVGLGLLGRRLELR